MGALRIRLVAALMLGGATGLSTGCIEDDSPTSFLPPAPKGDAGQGTGEDPGTSGPDGGDSMEGASVQADWCQPGHAVFYHPDIDPNAETFTLTGTLSRSVDPQSTDGQISIAVLTQNPVTLFLSGQPPEVPVVQLLVRHCDWSNASDTLEFRLENIPKKEGEDYYFASFFDTDKQQRPLSAQSGFITAVLSLTEVPRLPANPDGDTWEQDLELNAAVP
jgi:hypothetical protein